MANFSSHTFFSAFSSLSPTIKVRTYRNINKQQRLNNQPINHPAAHKHIYTRIYKSNTAAYSYTVSIISVSASTMAAPTEDKRKRDDEEGSASTSPTKKAKVAAKPKWLTDAMVEGFRDGDQDMEDVVKAITKAFRKTPDSKKFAKLEDELAKAQAYLLSMVVTSIEEDEQLHSLFDSVYDDSSIIPKKWRDDYGLDDY